MIEDTNEIGDTIGLGTLYGWGHSMVGVTLVGDTNGVGDTL